MALIAQVAVNSTTFHFDKLYSYLVPSELCVHAGIGCMVLVPFGRGSVKARMGVILALCEEESPAKNLKSLYDIAPEAARLSPELLALVHFLKETTFCTYYEAVKAIIPYGAQYKAINEGDAPHLKKQLTRHVENVYRQGVLPGKLTAKQSAAWNLLAKGALLQTELIRQGISKAVLDRMCEKAILTCTTQDKTLLLYENYAAENSDEIFLTPHQQEAFNALAPFLHAEKAHTALLYGVTSSGKTLVFLKLLEETLAAGRHALVLVPEISLTPQMIYRLKSVFGERVAVQHSALSNTERLLQWQQIQQGGADIVVGTRSAVFAPLQNIGLIIMDEEQENTYHSENSPRYDAHSVARVRAREHGALLLFASATPAVTSYYAAEQGRWQLVQLKERYNHMPLPAVRLVDMREELASGYAGSVSHALGVEISKNLAAQEQTILLLNRRGYQTVGMCTHCAEPVKCSACSVPMVYHKADDKLLCHYCGSALSPVPTECPTCGEKLRYTGFGTQRVEEELAEKFPAARILRMDMDTTGGKNAHENMLRAFARGEYDIMLGTQMVAKGLDFEKVTLVGVLGIDQLMFAQGYKAFETVFSLVTQVVGRGGRANTPGRALIQTVDPSHAILNLAAKQDYASFYEQEIAFRKLNLYPPFCALCMVGFSGEDERLTAEAACAFAQYMREEAASAGDKIPLRILGPAPMHITKVKNRYRFKLTVKCKEDSAFRALMRGALAAYSTAGWPQKAAVYLDFNSDADL